MVKNKRQKSKKNAALSAAVESAEQQEVEEQMKTVSVSETPDDVDGRVDESESMASACSTTVQRFDYEEGGQVDGLEESTGPADTGN